MSLSLPIDPLLPDIIRILQNSNSLVLVAPPGAGKTTRVPRALLEASINDGKEIIVLEPRRLAARLAARRVAEEMGERIGERVGYQVRFDEVGGANTSLRFVTEGILTRRLLSDPELKNVGAVILDEFHERHLQGDIALALLRNLQLTKRPDLILVVMSATLQTDPVAKFLGDCQIIHSQGKLFQIEIDYLPRPENRPLEEDVASAVKKLANDDGSGDILVFLPGAAEIRRARDECAKLNLDLLITPLHGDLPLEEQDRAVRPSTKRKVILSTNVAESSLTIEGVTAVIDSGLARVARYSHWSGLPALKIEKISRASAIQRSGRAGRTAPGRCLRLYSRQDFELRPEHESAEILRADLAETVLELLAAGIKNLDHFHWFEAPPAAALASAVQLLKRLSALDENGITELGRRMLQFPIHPRQARIILAAESRGVAEDGCLLAALIGEKDIRLSARAAGLVERGKRRNEQGPSDLLLLTDLFNEAKRVKFAADRLRNFGLDPGATNTVERVRRQLVQCLRAHRSPAPDQHDNNLLISILAGYPDRVARCRANANGRIELLFAGGGSAQLAESSVVRAAEFVVAIDAEQRQSGNLAGSKNLATQVSIASQIEPDWLLELFLDSIVETSEMVWNGETRRVELVKRLLYDQMVIEESRAPIIDHSAAAKILFDSARAIGWRAFADEDEIARWLARYNFVAETFPEAAFAKIGDDELDNALLALCQSRISFAQLKEAARAGELLDNLQKILTPEQRRLLNSMAPERTTLPGGRSAKINYEPGKPPWLASRLQDFFGMAKGPVIAGGRVPLVLHLLAPNQRPVQVTTDLAGFWQRAYQQVRKELSRKYPRHNWPDDPLKATPPTSGANRAKR